MRSHTFSALVLGLCLSGTAQAHRLDDYLQASTIMISRQDIALRLRLTPGVEVADPVIRQIDRNGDDILSSAEQAQYAASVGNALRLTLNGKPLTLRPDGRIFPSVQAMRAGTGAIELRFRAPVQLVADPYHLHYTSSVSGPDIVRLVNCLVPADPSLHVTGQNRSEDQSDYSLDFSAD